MVTRRTLIGIGIAAGGLAASAGGTAFAFSAAMKKASIPCDPRLSQVMKTRYGDLEYAVQGSGRPLLMIHGTGGGFDQGLLFTRQLHGKGYRIIAPSRFGYLRSSMPDDPSSANQADAFAELLDGLGIDQVAVAGGSAGALSAIEFAIRHPDRCMALLPIVPASYTPDQEAVTAANPPPGVEAAMVVLRSDFLFWCALVVASDLLVGTLLATDPALLGKVEPAEAARAREILWSILPVSRRAEGLLNDARLAGRPAPSALEKISAPTFAISVEDDRYGTAKAARYIAGQVPNAQLSLFPTGGHIWLGHEQEIFEQIDRFLKGDPLIAAKPAEGTS
ncbi:alpha/beta hydrolase [Nostoc sp. 3335mG]|nr:alpha/beta hydrolase [Nostoc sp. 3335mG]